MGLDMYLHKRTYVGANYEHNDVNGTIDLSFRGEKLPIKLKRVSYIVEDIAYWRKANAIHSWFVDNVQNGNDDCGEYYVPLDKLKELLKLCEDALYNKRLAPELLPTQSGFFFGSTNYDEYYYSDLAHTVEVLKSAIEEGGEYYYSSSW